MLDIELPKGSRVVVAMSGGVDSSVVAALLVESGYDVVGLTMQLYDNGAIMGKKGACCAGQDIYDARMVADRMGFPHYILDYESHFKQAVIEDFVDTYVKGYTPIPCVRCNQKVKFQDLLKVAKELGGAALATGHYVKRKVGNPVALYRAGDHTRDQSYFLFATTQEQLNYVRFPLGSTSKTQVRAQAERLGLNVAAKPDSQDICFAPDKDYVRVVTKYRPDAKKPGDIIHLDGRILGQHEGIIHFTVGQRRGLKVADSTPLFVVRVDAEQNHVIVGPKEALATHQIHLEEFNNLGAMPDHQWSAVTVKIRSAHAPVPAQIWIDASSARVQFPDPEYGVSPGQACVVYDQDRVLGGGWITSKHN